MNFTHQKPFDLIWYNKTMSQDYALLFFSIFQFIKNAYACTFLTIRLHRGTVFGKNLKIILYFFDWNSWNQIRTKIINIKNSLESNLSSPNTGSYPLFWMKWTTETLKIFIKNKWKFGKKRQEESIFDEIRVKIGTVWY